MKFDPCVFGGEAPVDRGGRHVAFLLQGLDFTFKGILSGDAPVENASSEHAELDLGHVKPATMFGGVVALHVN